MTFSQIKIIAIVSMVIDHVGFFFFPQFTLCRHIGRIAFPLFAWLIANGAHHTSDIKKYLYRLFVLALVSQIPFILALKDYNNFFTHLNVVFTLFLGLLAIFIIKKTTHKILWLPIILVCAELANLLHSDYGSLGVLSIVFFYIFFDRKILIVISQSIIFLVLPFLSNIVRTISENTVELTPLYMSLPIEKYALLSLPCIFLYNKRKGRDVRKFFYIFFPLHFAIIAILQVVLKTIQ